MVNVPADTKGMCWACWSCEMQLTHFLDVHFYVAQDRLHALAAELARRPCFFEAYLHAMACNLCMYCMFEQRMKVP